MKCSNLLKNFVKNFKIPSNTSPDMSSYKKPQPNQQRLLDQKNDVTLITHNKTIPSIVSQLIFDKWRNFRHRDLVERSQLLHGLFIESSSVF